MSAPKLPRFALLLLLIAATRSSAEPPSAKFDAPKLNKTLEEKLAPFWAQGGEVPGMVVVVGNAEGAVAHQAFGTRDLQSAKPMEPDTLFQIASMTKPITAIALAMLAEEGKLSFDDPVEKHLPEFRGQRLVVARDGDAVTTKPAPRPITIRELLTHTSGMAGGPPAGLSELYRQRNRTLAEGVLAYSQLPLEFEPGTRWSYSNTGIDTGGRIVEVVSGKSFEDFLAERIFAPLGMKDTTFYPTPEQRERLATMYRRDGEKLLPAEESLIETPAGAKYPLPAGGLYSTGTDLAKLYAMMLGHGTFGGKQILSAESVNELTRLQTREIQTGFVPGMGYGLGFAHVREPQGVTAALSPGSFGHGGAFGTQAWIDPQRGWYAVLLIQRVGLPNSDASEMRATLQQTAAEAIAP
jgi:CubicO group peptidase (beta-lactamase class C family)